MKIFNLLIGTPEGMVYEGQAESIRCRTIYGDVAILAGHSNYCTALGEGESKVILSGGTSRKARCSGGMIVVLDGKCRVFSRNWEWQE